MSSAEEDADLDLLGYVDKPFRPTEGLLYDGERRDIPHSCQPPNQVDYGPRAAGRNPLAFATTHLNGAIWRCKCGRYWRVRHCSWMQISMLGARRLLKRLDAKGLAGNTHKPEPSCPRREHPYPARTSRRCS